MWYILITSDPTKAEEGWVLKTQFSSALDCIKFLQAIFDYIPPLSGWQREIENAERRCIGYHLPGRKPWIKLRENI